MSLINQMLRDLDQQRGADNRPQLKAVTGAVHSVPGGGGLPKGLIAVALLLVLTLAGGLYWLHGSGMKSEPMVALTADPVASGPGDEPPAARVGSAESIDQPAAHETATGVIPVPEPGMTSSPKSITQQPEQEQVKPLDQPTATTPEVVTAGKSAIRPDSEGKSGPKRLALASRPGSGRPGDLPAGSRSDRTPKQARKPVEQSRPETSTQSSPPVKIVKQSKRPVTSPYQQAKSAYLRGELGEAERLLLAQIKAYPDHLGSRLLLAQILMRGGRSQEAALLLDKGLARSPGSGALATLRARIWLDQGDTGQAMRVLEDARRSGDRSLAVVELLAPLYQQAGDFVAAQAAYRQLLQQKPASASAWAGLGISSDALEQTDAAVAAYRRALQIGGLPAAVQTYIQQRLAVRQGSRS